MKKFPYQSLFKEIKIKPVVSEEKDKYLSVASLQEVSKFLPQIDLSKNVDLLPVAFDSCVVNRVNKNGDVIDTATAVEIYKHFAFKPLNIEHRRKDVIGVILNAGFSEFGTDKPLTEEEVKAMTGPFNIVLGGVVWRLVDEKLSDKIEDASDPTSDYYQDISASWELGFTDFHLVALPKGERNIEAGRFYTDASEVSQLSNKLRGMGGDGNLNENENIYRVCKGSVVPLGCGFTEKPAADVSGIATPKSQEIAKEEEVIEASTKEKEENLEKNENSISQSQNVNVNTNRKDMKITSIAQITDDLLKEVKASAIAEFIADEIKKKDAEFVAVKEAAEQKVKDAEAAAATIKSEQEKLTNDVKTLTDKVKAFELKEQEAAKLAQFNARMQALSEIFDLDEEVSKFVVEEVKATDSDESFNKLKSKYEVLLAAKKKGAKAPPFAKKGEEKEEEKEGKEGKHMEEECASKKEEAKEAKAAVENAVENADKEKAKITNTSSASEDLMAKAAKAFGIEGFSFSKKKN